jgi:hypothetical protein
MLITGMSVNGQNVIDSVIQTVTKSNIYKYHWKQRGIAPAGYMKGMGLSFAECLLQYRSGSEFEVEMAKANTGNDHKDALSWYNSNFRRLGMNNDESGENTLRHLFVLMLGLGMRESSGQHCDGRDTSAHNVSSDSAEAGMFQMSWDISAGSSLFQKLYEEFHDDHSDDLLHYFSEGVHCSRSQWAIFGSGTGANFQTMCKSQPLFSVKTCGVGLRNIRTHWGPINRKEAEITLGADTMFKNIAGLLDVAAPPPMTILPPTS